MSARAAGSISRISIRDLLEGGETESEPRDAASVYGRRRQVSSNARCGVTPMAIEGAPRRRSIDQLLDVGLTTVSQPFLTNLIKFGEAAFCQVVLDRDLLSSHP